MIFANLGSLPDNIEEINQENINVFNEKGKKPLVLNSNEIKNKLLQSSNIITYQKIIMLNPSIVTLYRINLTTLAQGM